MRKKSSPKINPTNQPSELEQQKLAYHRLAADFANYQKRVEQEQSQITRRANDALLTKLFPIFDSFYLAIRHNPTDLVEKPQLSREDREKILQFIEGIGLIEKQLEDTLGQVGLAKVVTTGETFDPANHEAVSYEDNSDIPTDTIIDEIEAGWMIDGIVIKPAKVRVSRG